MHTDKLEKIAEARTPSDCGYDGNPPVCTASLKAALAHAATAVRASSNPPTSPRNVSQAREEVERLRALSCELQGELELLSCEVECARVQAKRASQAGRDAELSSLREALESSEQLGAVWRAQLAMVTEALVVQGGELQAARARVR